MKRRCGYIFVLFFVTFGSSLKAAQSLGNESVVRLDPALDSLVPSDAKLELAKGGFVFTEGTTWVRKGSSGYLLFSDIEANVIYKMTLAGDVSVFLNQSGYNGPMNGFAFMNVGVETDNRRDPKDPLFRRWIQVGSDGLTLDPQGRLLICTLAGRSIDRIEKNGKRNVLADRYEGKRFGGTNDVIVKNNGTIYFSDTFGGMRGREKDSSAELDFQGIYMLKNGKVTLAIKDIPTPNGLAFSPDEKYLYVNASGAGNYIRRYDVQPDDTLTNSQMLIDLRADKTPGFTDGMRVDAKGNIYSTGPGGLWIITPGGKHIGTIRVPELAANLTFGGPDYKTVFIAARTSIYKIRVNTRGHHR